MPKDRFLFVDLVRIGAISLVLFYHVASTPAGQWIWNYFFTINVFNLYYGNYGTIGVSLFLFASGCSLALSCAHTDLIPGVKNFYGKRVLRIYPAYWTGILFAIMLDIGILQKEFSMIDVFRLISGFQSFGAKTVEDFYGKVNGNFWFLTPILSMYLLFPIVFFAIKKHPHITILSLLGISIVSRYYMSTPVFYRGIDWFPLCVVFEFGLGVYLIKVGLYPRLPSGKLYAFLSNITFYAYLINAPLLRMTSYTILFVVALLIVATMMYIFDQALRHAIVSGLNYVRLKARTATPANSNNQD